MAIQWTPMKNHWNLMQKLKEIEKKVIIIKWDECGHLLNLISVALNQQILQNVNQSWQTLAAANSANSVDYSSHLLSATLPISIQHFLKYSETIKKESSSIVGASNSGNISFSNLEISGSSAVNNMSTINKGKI